MTIKCETMVETATNPQAPESNQASVPDDSSAKMIEFLRARLLAERAASKAARQQAQEIAEKVKDLNARLEMEIKSRKEAESAMGKVFTILKAKGLALDTLASTDLKDKPEKGVSALDDVKEMNEDPHKEVLLKPLPNKDESAENGMIKEKKHSTREPHASDLESDIGIVSEADQTLGPPCNVHEEASPQHAVAVTDKPMVYTDNMSPKCPPNVEKDSHTAEAFDEGSSITLKLKAMLHQMEEEMAALPKEQQPLKLQLKSWVDHVAGVLHMEKESGLNTDVNGSVNAATNYPLKEAEKVNVVALNKIHDIPGGVDDTKEEMGKTLSIVPEDMVQQSKVMPPCGDYKGPYPSTIYPPPTCKDPSLPSKVFHNRRSSYEALHFLQQPPNMPVPPQMMQYGVSQPSVAHAPLFANGYTANGPPCYVEAQSPRSSDAFSLADGPSTMGYRHRQLCETRSQGRGLGIERQAGFREDAMKCRSEMWSQAGFGFRDMLSSPYLVDVSDEVHMNQDKYLSTQNIHLRRGHSYSHRMYMDQAKNAAELNMARPPQSFPVSDATLSLTDDRNGRLGDILMVLDAARQHVNEEEQSLYGEELLFGPPTPTVDEARLTRGHLYGDDTQQMPYEHLNHTRRSRAHSQAPIIQFPPSPASEHGYSPFERGHGRHRRSSSVSANFMMSGWDSSLQPRGEVQLGNGITLYTD